MKIGEVKLNRRTRAELIAQVEAAKILVERFKTDQDAAKKEHDDLVKERDDLVWQKNMAERNAADLTAENKRIVRSLNTVIQHIGCRDDG
jgi:peptidoglycan hydrolase CwlO-like protein